MESSAQPTARSRGVSVVGAFSGMLITFVAGIYVGLHPSWIPIKGSGSSGVDLPAKSEPTIMSNPDHAMPSPATMPATSGT